MVFYDLIIKLISENASSIKVDSKNYVWSFVIQCGKCFQNQPNEIHFSLSDSVETDKDFNKVNFFMKCKECKSPFTINVLPNSSFKVDLPNGNDSGVLSSFECRGVSLVSFKPNDDLIIEGIDSGFEFNSDLTTETCEYDDRANLMINILEPAVWTLTTRK